MNLDDVQDAIVERLKAWPAFVDTNVDHFPDVPARYAFGAAGEELLVGYEGSQYAGADAIVPVSQQRTVDFVVTVISRSLRGPSGVMQMIEDTRAALFGWKPITAGGATLGFTPMVLTKDQFIGEDEGIWRYAIYFQSTTTTVASATELAGPAISGATVKTAAGAPGEDFEITP